MKSAYPDGYLKKPFIDVLKILGKMEDKDDELEEEDDGSGIPA